MKQEFVIFDRDGTLINHVHHLVDPELVKPKNDVIQALQLLQSYNFKLGINRVSCRGKLVMGERLLCVNQCCIARFS